eukprot:1156841-Pelagomonas_calceolata.AAC.8
MDLKHGQSAWSTMTSPEKHNGLTLKKAWPTSKRCGLVAHREGASLDSQRNSEDPGSIKAYHEWLEGQYRAFQDPRGHDLQDEQPAQQQCTVRALKQDVEILLTALPVKRNCRAAFAACTFAAHVHPNGQ